MKSTLSILNDYMIKPKGMMIWRDIPGYEGSYQISNHGDVCSVWDRVLNHNGQVILTSIDKSRQQISVNKLLRTYWKESDINKDEERWKKLDHYGDYYISNYGNVKNCRRLILWPSKNGNVILYSRGKKNRERKTITVLNLFINTFPPEEIFVNHETKSVNYVKKNDDFIESKRCG